MEKKNLKILIIRFSSIGDIILTTPVIRCIKQQLPGVTLHYFTKKIYESVLAASPYIDKLHLLGPSLTTAVDLLKAENFDYVIDLHHNLRTLLIKRKLGVESFSFNKLNMQKWLIVNLKINRLPKLHIVDRYLKTAEFLDIKNDGKGLDYFLNQDYELQKLLPARHQRYIGLVIGAQHVTKRLPVYKLAEICMHIKQPIVLLGGPEDVFRGDEIVRYSGKHVFNGCGRFTLDQSAFLVKHASKIITHDTGLMHIAAAFNKPIVSVWGNTIPEFGMYPYQTDESVIIEVKRLPCRPCSKIGYKKCPQGHFKCMNNINVSSIVKFAAK